MAYFDTPIKRYNTIYIDGIFKPNSIIKAYSADPIYGSFSTQFRMNNGRSVIFNGSLHIFSGTSHYRYYNGTWISVSTLPVSLNGGAIVAHNSKLYFIQGTAMYEYSNDEWTDTEITSPFNMTSGDAVSFNNAIYVITNGHMYHFINQSWNNDSIKSGLNLTTGKMLVVDDEIHTFGNDSSNKRQHYKFSPTFGWSTVSTLPADFSNDIVILVNDVIHLFIGDGSTTTNHYKYNEDTKSWVLANTLSGMSARNGTGQFLKGIMYLLSYYSMTYQELYRIEEVSNLLEATV